MNRQRYPDIFLCGAPKCATTTLARALAGHDGIFVPAVKEPSYFAPAYAGAASRIGDDVDAYLALYAAAGSDQRLLDASILYLFSNTAIAAILARVPDARFICVLRPPLDLFLSWHAHLLRLDLEDQPDPERAWRLVAERRAGASLPPGLRWPEFVDYERFCRLGAQCRRLLHLAGRERVLILTFEEVTQQWAATRVRLLDFLNLADAPLELGWENAGRVTEWPSLNRLRRRAATRADRLLTSIGIRRRFGLSQWLYRATSRPLTEPRLSDRFMAELKTAISPDLALLAEVTGVRLPLRAS